MEALAAVSFLCVVERVKLWKVRTAMSPLSRGPLVLVRVWTGGIKLWKDILFDKFMMEKRVCKINCVIEVEDRSGSCQISC